MVHFSHHKTLGLLAFGISIGIGINFELEFHNNDLIFLLTVLISSLNLFINFRLLNTIISLVSFIGLGMLSIGIPQERSKDIPKEIGIIEIQQLISRTAYYDSYEVQMISQNKQKLLLKLKSKDSTAYKPGDQFQYFKKPTPLNYPSYPGGFDYKNYLHKRGIGYELIQPTLIQLPFSNSLKRFANKLQTSLVDRFNKHLHSTREQTTAVALLLGYRTPEFKLLQETYAKTGVSHLLAISGLHTSLVFTLIYLLLWPLGFFKKGKQIRWCVALIALWGFTLLSGWSHSVVRASMLLSFYGVAIILKRANHSFHFLLLAYIITILINPFALFQVGFQMSYTAVFFILWLYPILRKKLKHPNKLLDHILNLSAISLAAQIGVVPLSLYYFKSIPIHFLLGNLLLVPLMGIVIYYGILSLAFTTLIPLFEKLLYYLNELIAYLAIDSFSLKWSIDLIQLALIYTVIISLFILIRVKSKQLKHLLLLQVFLLQCYSLYQIEVLYQKEFIMIHGSFEDPHLFYKKGSTLYSYTNHQSSKALLEDLKFHYKLKTIESQPLTYAYKTKQYSLIHLNKSIYPTNNKTDLLLLSQDLKVHFERLIDSLNPKVIVVNKNIPSWDLDRWKSTAQTKKIPLIDLRSVGFYIIDFN